MLRVVETFSGIGAQAKALENLKNQFGMEYEILNTADWDINAILAYDYIHNGNPKPSIFDDMSKEDLLKILSKYTLSFDGKSPTPFSKVEKQNVELLRKICYSISSTRNLISVTDIKGEDLPNEMNILTYSFPCQDLSVAGYWHGNKGGIDKNANNRSSMLWQIGRILNERKEQNLPLPKFLLMENVRNIMSKQHEKNFEEWKNSLKRLGYQNFVLSLNAKNFGAPQKRNRAYMISVLTNNDKNLEKSIKKYFEDNDLQKIEDASSLNRKKRSISEILRIDYSVDIYKREADESQPNNTSSRRDIYQNNDKLYHDGKFADIAPTLTTKQDRHPNSGVIDYDNKKKNKCKFRYLTPREGFMLMGFEESDYEQIVNNNFKTVKGHDFFTRDKLNKMAGNSIVVDVLEEIFKQIEYINQIYFQEQE